jgi:translocation and assembly module TamB
MSKHKVLRWTLMVLPLAVVALFAAAALILHSAAFQAYALHKITQIASESTGTQIQIQRMTVAWRPFAVEFTGVTAQNPAAPSETPLFSAARLQIGLQLWPLLHRQVQVRDVLLDHPSVYISTDATGRTNLPTFKSNDQSPNSALAVQIAHFVIQDGLVRYEDRQIPLSAELTGFRTQVNFDRLTNSYQGHIAYEAGRLETPGVRTFEHHADIRFAADARHCTIEHLDLATLHSHLTARGDLTDYSNPVFAGDYEGHVLADDLRFILRNAALPSGDIFLRGKFIYRAPAGPSWTDRTFVDGSMESAALRVRNGQTPVDVRALRASYRLEYGQLRVEDARAGVLGGQLTSDSDTIDLQRNSARLHFTITGASVEQAFIVFGNASQAPQIASLADLDAHVNWNKAPRQAVVHAQANLHKTPSSAANVIPIDGNIALDYDAGQNRISFQPSTLRTNRAELTASGVVSRDSALQVRLSTNDLHDLSALISAVAPSDLSQRISAYDPHGAGELSGKISGAVTDPHFVGQLSFTNLQLANTKWRSLRTGITLDSKSVALSDGSLVSAQQGRLTFSGSTKLSNWTPNPNAPLSFRTHIAQLSTTDIQHLANINYPVDGQLNGDLTVSGSQQHPAASGHLELNKAVVWNEPLKSFALKVNADKQTIHLTADVHASAGVLNANLDYDPSSKHYEVAANTNALALDKVDALQRSVGAVTGQLSAAVSGTGTLDNPQLVAHLEIPVLQIRDETFQQINAQLQAQNKHTEFSLRSAVEKTSIQAHGTVELTPGYPANINLDTGTIPISMLLARFSPGAQQGPSGQMEVHATVQGPLQNPSQLQAHAEIPTLQVQEQSFALANAGPIRLDYRGGVLQLDRAEFKGQGTDLRLGGSVPIQVPGNMKVSADGSVDLSILQPWTNGGHSSGQLTLQLHAEGPKNQPNLGGRVQLVNAMYTSDALPVGIEALNGDISIDGNRVNIANLSAKVGGGTIAVTGTGAYAQNSTFNLAMRAKSVRIRQNGVRAVSDADLNWSGSLNASTLAGRVTVDKLAFNQGSDLSEILSQFSSDNTLSEPSKFASSIQLNVAVQSSQDLSVSSSQLSIAGSADLTAQGTAGQPILLGRVLLTSGEVFFLGKRFEIDSGTIAFSNPVRTAPVVNLHVKTTVEQYNITANVSGPVDQLKTSYTSDPALPTADIINLLAFGQTTAEAASNASQPASMGAESAVASAAGGQVASQVQKLTGISQLTLNPLAGNQNPGSQVAVQQRVSANILLTFSTDVTSAENQSVQVQYKVRRNVSVSALRDENGGYGINVQYHKAF